MTNKPLYCTEYLTEDILLVETPSEVYMGSSIYPIPVIEEERAYIILQHCKLTDLPVSERYKYVLKEVLMVDPDKHSLDELIEMFTPKEIKEVEANLENVLEVALDKFTLSGDYDKDKKALLEKLEEIGNAPC